MRGTPVYGLSAGGTDGSRDEGYVSVRICRASVLHDGPRCADCSEPSVRWHHPLLAARRRFDSVGPQRIIGTIDHMFHWKIGQFANRGQLEPHFDIARRLTPSRVRRGAALKHGDCRYDRPISTQVRRRDRPLKHSEGDGRRGPFAMCLRTPRRQWGYDERVDGRFARRTDFAGFSGASVDDGASTTRGDENVRTPCASKSITVWYSFTLLRVPCPYCVCVTRSPGAYLSMSSPT